MRPSFRLLLAVHPPVVLLAAALLAASAPANPGPVCKPGRECEAACSAEAWETRQACVRAGTPRSVCKARLLAQEAACVASTCNPVLRCEARCAAQAADLLRRCLAGAVDVQACQSQAQRIEAACVEATCEPCICPEVYAPVCGTDGVTYGNACEARCAHVEVEHGGGCEPCPTPACDLSCEFGFQAGPDGCPTCECDEPCVCPEVYQPVCGADGETYSNACFARCADVEVVHEGDCARDCDGNADCEPGDVCYPPSRTCQPVCEIDCFAPDPVCGTDGVTYSCGAQDAFCHGAEVAFPGECRCFGDQDCSPGSLCNAAEICLPLPGCEPPGCPAVCTGFCVDCACPEIFDPVCGVDGITYGNSCEASCAHVGVSQDGPCD